jgi:hypothetical protein
MIAIGNIPVKFFNISCVTFYNIAFNDMEIIFGGSMT